MILGDTNPSTLATNLHILYHPVPQIKLETRIQAGPYPSADVGDSIGIAEYLGKRSTATLTVHNPKRASGRMTIGYLYSLTKNFCAGAELLAEWQQQQELKYTLALAARWVAIFFYMPLKIFFIPLATADCSHCSHFSNAKIFFSLFVYVDIFPCLCISISTQITRSIPTFMSQAHTQKFLHFQYCRYSMKKSSVAATISKDALDISFWHQPRAFMQLGASFIWIARTSRTLAQICYQLEMRDSIIKAMIDSDCAVGCTYSRYIGPFFRRSLNFSISLIRILVKSVTFN